MNRSSARTSFENESKKRSKFSYRSCKNVEKSFKIVAETVQNRSLEEVWVALGANWGVFVVSWGILRVSCGVLGDSWSALQGVLGAFSGFLGVAWGNFGRPLGHPGAYWRILERLGDVLGLIFVAMIFRLWQIILDAIF